VRTRSAARGSAEQGRRFSSLARTLLPSIPRDADSSAIPRRELEKYSSKLDAVLAALRGLVELAPADRLVVRCLQHEVRLAVAGRQAAVPLIKPLGLLFPVLIAMLVPIRRSLARFFDPAHLRALDAQEETEVFEETGGGRLGP
jgi:hypothetical protein